MALAPVDEELVRILCRAFPGSRLESWAALKGGVSARAVVVDLVLRDTTKQRVVVRRPSYATPDETLRVVECEYRLLLHCSTMGIPAPKPCSLDLTAGALVLEYVDGTPEFAPHGQGDLLEQMATQLASIHRVSNTSALEFLQRRKQSVERDLTHPPAQLDATLDEASLRSVLTKLWPWPQHNHDVLLHGDYWPGNLLWRGGKLVAVLDWEEAEVGDPLADLAVSRLDILWAFGKTAMTAFTNAYRRQTQIDWRNLPRWDLLVALRPMSNLPIWAEVYRESPICRPDITERSMREDHRWFVRNALHELGLHPY